MAKKAGYPKKMGGGKKMVHGPAMKLSPKK